LIICSLYQTESFSFYGKQIDFSQDSLLKAGSTGSFVSPDRLWCWYVHIPFIACVFVNSALKIQCHVVKHTLLRTAFSAILPTGIVECHL